jgi:hypothetical protein
MTRIIEDLDFDDAKEVLRYAYEADRSSTYQGHWGDKRHVHGSIIRATWDASQQTVTVSAGALSSESALADYVLPAYRDHLVEQGNVAA